MKKKKGIFLITEGRTIWWNQIYSLCIFSLDCCKLDEMVLPEKAQLLLRLNAHLLCSRSNDHGEQLTVPSGVSLNK